MTGSYLKQRQLLPFKNVPLKTTPQDFLQKGILPAKHLGPPPQVILSPGQMAESVGSSQFGHLLLQIGEMNQDRPSSLGVRSGSHRSSLG